MIPGPSDRAAKVATARMLRGFSVHAHEGFGRWAFIASSDPWDAGNTIRAFLRGSYNPPAELAA